MRDDVRIATVELHQMVAVLQALLDCRKPRGPVAAYAIDLADQIHEGLEALESLLDDP